MDKILKAVKILDIVKTNILCNLTVFTSIKSQFLTPLLFKEKGAWYSALHGSWCMVRSSAASDRSMYQSSVRNSSYSFMLIFFKLHTYFCHDLKMCMLFGYNPLINMYHSLSAFWKIIFQAPILYSYQSIWCPKLLQFYAVFFLLFFFLFKLYRCFCHGLKTCMWFGYNPQISLSLSTFWT